MGKTNKLEMQHSTNYHTNYGHKINNLSLKAYKQEDYGNKITYSSSGVRLTGSSVNSGGKLAKSRSDSRRGRNGGVICFCSSYRFRFAETRRAVKPNKTHKIYVVETKTRKKKNKT